MLDRLGLAACSRGLGAMLSVAILAIQCALPVDQAVLEAIVEVESQGNPYALAVNGPVELVRPPRDRDEAVLMARWLEEHGYNFDAGLGQVNSANLGWLGLDVVSVFDPCANLRAASRVLHDCYDRAAERWSEGDAVVAALSCYNTGDFTRGVLNGYVDAVRSRARGPLVIRARSEREREDGVCWARPSPAKKPRAGVARVESKPRPEVEAKQVADVFAEPLADAFDKGR